MFPSLRRQTEESTSFLKKRSKRLLGFWLRLSESVVNEQKFFGSFFQKRTSSFNTP
jgi:hypothetical protein